MEKLSEACFMCGKEADLTINLDGRTKRSCEACSKVILKAKHRTGAKVFWNAIERILTIKSKASV